MAENPQAFPLPASSFGPGGDMAHPEEGMTLRDWFAGQALVAVGALIGIPEAEPDELWNAETARHCFAIADAMLEERNR